MRLLTFLILGLGLILTTGFTPGSSLISTSDKIVNISPSETVLSVKAPRLMRFIQILIAGDSVDAPMILFK